MYLLILVLGIVLLPEASSLRCYECKPQSGTCTETTTQCPSEKNQCAVQRLLSYTDGSEVWNVTGKSCVLPEECGQHSFNIGHYRTVTASKCCSTDLCNTQPAPKITPDVPNGRKCFVCDGQTCNATLNCRGNEYHCISTTLHSSGSMVTMKGCISKAKCLYMQSAWMTQVTLGEMSCCQGDYCNSASSTSAGLMLLVAPLISLVLL